LFSAEKDLNKLATNIAKERSKSEIEPATKGCKAVSTDVETKTTEGKYFAEQTDKRPEFVLNADYIIEKAAQHKDNWLTKLLVKTMK